MPNLPEGVTPRILGYWIKRGWIPLEDSTPGRGHPRKWTNEAWRKLVAMGRLRPLGFTAPRAAQVAQAIVDAANASAVEISLGHGITIIVSPERFFDGVEDLTAEELDTPA